MELSNIQDFIKKAQDMSKDNKMDLSSGEDLSVAVMNLISLEEHFFYTSQKTKNDKYLDLLTTAREMRKDLMKKLVKNPDGEVWCISKHLLSASMRLMEVGTKELARGRKKEASDLFTKSYQLYTIFWGLTLKAIDIGSVKKVHEEHNTLLGKLDDMIKKVVDCCIE